jgi:hypothetical protein
MAPQIVLQRGVKKCDRGEIRLMAGKPDSATDPRPAAMAMARRRLVPLLTLVYVIAWLDRVNIGFVALQMNRDLAFSPAVYGFGQGFSS